MENGSFLWINGTVRYALLVRLIIKARRRGEIRVGTASLGSYQLFRGIQQQNWDDTDAAKVGIDPHSAGTGKGDTMPRWNDSSMHDDFDYANSVALPLPIDNLAPESRSPPASLGSGRLCAVSVVMHSCRVSAPAFPRVSERIRESEKTANREMVVVLVRIMSNPRPAGPQRTGSGSGVSQPLSRGTTLGSASSDVERKKRSRNLLRDYYGLAGKAGDPLDIGQSVRSSPGASAHFEGKRQIYRKRSMRSCTLRR